MGFRVDGLGFIVEGVLSFGGRCDQVVVELEADEVGQRLHLVWYFKHLEPQSPCAQYLKHL